MNGKEHVHEGPQAADDPPGADVGLVGTAESKATSPVQGICVLRATGSESGVQFKD